MLVELLILALATYGISMLLTSSDGLYGVFLRLRNKYPNSALQCLKCTSVYVALGLFIVFLLGWAFWLIPFAIVGAVILLEEATTC